MISPDLVWGSFCSKRCAAPRTPPLSGCAFGGGADQASSFLLSSGGLQLVGGAPSAGAVAQDGSSSCCRLWSAACSEGSLKGLSSLIVYRYVPDGVVIGLFL